MLPRSRIEILDNSTGEILFTLVPGPDESTYILDDMTGFVRGVSVYHVPVDYWMSKATPPNIPS